MKRFTLGSLLAFSLFSCGGEPMSTTTTTSETCNQRHACINGSCTCSEGPKKDSSCCDPSDSSCTVNKCDTYCRYCM